MTVRQGPRGLLTIPEVARLFHTSDDTVRRQIRAGDLEAVQIGTTPTGRPRYRVAADVVEARLGRPAGELPSAAERLQAAFGVLTEAQQEALLVQAITWARTQAPETGPTGNRLPEPSQADIARRFPGLTRRERDH
ncbi:hypothetical protein QR90_08715 [Deinococcus radiopugnans]|uniref:Helix-turn-helix domain-containing protein n=1 Tax=Deinococcus radiopugnans TaxID=57497 RepID=A0A0A7KKS6_9DEIO|nr:helix-turn-helix domain-containing protein [Deinococcus radiopugnans]AIZ45168.1 hypothetical protein QR90_08715 [Deinococcus radiopugnans]